MTDMRLKALSEWCRAELGRHCGPLQPLASEASSRRFFRIRDASLERSWIAMDSPPESENNQQFVQLSAVFRQHCVPVPQVHVFDLDRGFLLVEDFGDQLFLNEYPKRDRGPLILLAMSSLCQIQTLEHPSIPPYKEDRFRAELEIFREWLCGALLGFDGTPVDDAEEFLVHEILKQPPSVVHRDFHSRNLLVRECAGSGRDLCIGIVDFQDALVGPLAYDLASYVYDCYWEWAEPEILQSLQLVWKSLDPNRKREIGSQERFREMVDILALQRMLKAAGIFCRLYLQRNRTSHLPYVVPVLRRTSNLALKYRGTESLGLWLSKTVIPATEACMPSQIAS